MGVLPRTGWTRALALSLVALAVLEAGLRLWIISPAAPRTATPTGWIDEPHHRVVFSREGYSRTRVNAFGYHDQEPKQQYQWRALVLGDSYGEAFQVPREQSFVQVTERAVPGLDVVNTSRSALTLLHYALYAADQAAIWDPDLLVVVINDTDIDDLLGMDLSPDPEATLRGFARGEQAALRGWTGWKGLVEEGMTHSALLTFLYHRTRLLMASESRRLRDKFAGDRAAANAPAEDLRSLGPLLSRIHSEISGTGADVLYLYIPDIVYASSGNTLARPQYRDFYRHFADATGARLIDLSEPYLQAVKSRGQPVHGFQNSVLGTGHINALGHEIAGRELARALENTLR